jgi:hypothetical protein
MAMFKSSNPTLTAKIFDKSLHENASAFGVMSIRGTMNKFGSVSYTHLTLPTKLL